MGVYRSAWNYSAARQTQRKFAPSTPAPAFIAGPVAANLTTTGYDVQLTMNKVCTISILVAASQPSDAAFDASSETVAASAGVATSLHHTG